MITVHHLDHSRSQRVLWLLEELGLTYDIKFYKRGSDYLAPPELKAVHPLGKSPVLEDSQSPGYVFAESGAILDYILQAYGDGRLVPPLGTKDRLDYTYWMYAAEGTFMTPLLLKLICDNMVSRAPLFIRPLTKGISKKLADTLVTPNLTAHRQFWEDTLAKAPWFAGETFTAADIMMSFPMETSRRAGAPLTHCKAWLDAIHARPAYRRALERGGPYTYA